MSKPGSGEKDAADREHSWMCGHGGPCGACRPDSQATESAAPVPNPQFPMDGVWRCSGCGEMKVLLDTAWRWTGERWEHQCGNPQIGCNPARYFGPADPPAPPIAKPQEPPKWAIEAGKAIEAADFEGETGADDYARLIHAAWLASPEARALQPGAMYCIGCGIRPGEKHEAGCVVARVSVLEGVLRQALSHVVSGWPRSAETEELITKALAESADRGEEKG